MISIILLLLLLTTTAFCQEQVDFKPVNVDIGQNVLTNASVKALQFTMPENIYKLYVDSAKMEAILLTRKFRNSMLGDNGQLAVIDLKTKNLKWIENIHSFVLNVGNEHIFLTQEGNTHCFSRSNGERIWKKLDANVRYIDDEKGIVICQSTNTMELLKALNIKTGEEIWRRPMSGKYDWDDYRLLNDSTILLAAGGLHLINLNTGNGWRFKDVIGEDDNSATTPVSTSTAIVTPVFTYISIQRGPRTTRSTTSQILQDRELFYFATKERLVCVNATGKLIWEKQLPRKKTGISTLFLKDDNIILLNKALTYTTAGEPLRMGEPYIISVKKVTGQEQYTIELSEKNFIEDLMLANDTITLLSNKIFYQYNIVTGNQIQIKKVTNRGHNLFIKPDEVFTITSDSTFKSIQELYPSQYVILQSPDVMNLYSSTLEEQKSIPVEKLYASYKRTAQYSCLLFNGRSFVIKSNRKVADLNIPDGICIKDKIYSIEKDHFIITDLSAL